MSRPIIALLLTVSLAAAACSDANEESSPEDGEQTTVSLDELFDDLEGLTGDERRARLLQLALEEDSDITLYTSLSVDDSGPLVDAFEDQYDIGTDLYRASASTVAQRLLLEADAGFAGADVVMVNGTEMTVLDAEGLLAPFPSPVTDDLMPSVVFENWVGVYVQVFAAAWNTNFVDTSDAPETWEEVLTDYPGTLGMELGDFDWFATLIKDYFTTERGMSEDEAVALFSEAAKGALVVDGHTLMAEMLAGGTFDVASSPYQHRIQRLNGDGAPVAWEPAVEPLIARPNGVAIHRDTDSPATALLLVEWILTDAQQMFAMDFGRTPTNRLVEGGIPEGYEVLTVDLVALLEEREKWEGLYESVVTQSGQAVGGD